MARQACTEQAVGDRVKVFYILFPGTRGCSNADKKKLFEFIHALMNRGEKVRK